MPLLDLPNELLLGVAEYIDRLRDINAFARTNWRLYSVGNGMLYRSDALTGGRALHWAARHGLMQTARLSLAEGVCVDKTYPQRNLRDRIPRTDEQDRWTSLTPLQIAICCKHENVARFLVERGANFKRVCHGPLRKLTLLHVASALGLFALVQLLLEKGAKLHAQDGLQRTPLHYAVKPWRRIPKTPQHVETVRVLIERGAIHTLRDRDGRTPEDLINQDTQLYISSSRKDRSQSIDYNSGLERLVPFKRRRSDGIEQETLRAEKAIKTLLEAKRAVLVVAKWDKDRELRRKTLTL